MRLHTLDRMFTGRRALGTKRPSRQTTPPAVTPLETRRLPSLSVIIDYSFDTNNFFNTQARRDVMQAAANAIASGLSDNLSAIAPGGSNSWSAQFPDPSTGATRSIANLNVPANTLILYVGGGRLPGTSEAGQGSTGGYRASGDVNWLNTVAARGQAGALAAPQTDFGPWGGSITFDDSGTTNWYFGQNAAGISAGQTDFLSVAEHEVGHVFGLGTAPSWTNKVSGGSFRGTNAVAVYGGPVPVDPGGQHWAQGVRSDGGNALMDPVLLNGTRVVATSLDFTALKDVGWQVQSTAPAVRFGTTTYTTMEAVAGVGTAQITVTRTSGTGAFSVNYATSNGSARAGVNYQTTQGTLSFAAGEVSKTFSIPILNDGAVNAPRTVNLTLSGPTGGASLGSPNTAVLTIFDATYHAPGDFDRDGRTDPGVFRPGSAQWMINLSTSGPLQPAPVFGAPNLYDIPIIGDFDGVGHAEVGVFRPSTAQWFVLGPTGGRLLGTFGGTNMLDIPVPGDYDGVGHTQMAVFRPSTAQWFVLGPNGGHLLGTFGGTNMLDIPAPGDYDGVGRTQMAVFRPSTSQWFVLGPTGGRLLGTFGGPNLMDIPVPGDYDGVGHTQMAVYRPSTGQWLVLGPNGGHLQTTYGNPTYSDMPIEASIGSLVKLGAFGGTSAKRNATVTSMSTASVAGPSIDSAPVSAPLTVADSLSPIPNPLAYGSQARRRWVIDALRRSRLG